MGLIDLSIIAHSSKPSACFTKGFVNIEEKKILQYRIYPCIMRTFFP